MSVNKLFVVGKRRSICEFINSLLSEKSHESCWLLTWWRVILRHLVSVGLDLPGRPWFLKSQHTQRPHLCSSLLRDPRPHLDLFVKTTGGSLDCGFLPVLSKGLSPGLGTFFLGSLLEFRFLT